MQKPIFNWLDHRGAGVLLHPTSLPGDYGIGTLNDHCLEFIDFLSDAGFTYWQVCPLGPTGFGDSPYQSFSSFAGNPYLISLKAISELGLLAPAILEDLSALPKSVVDYGGLFNAKWPVLDAVYHTYTNDSSIELPYGDFEEFCDQEGSWLEPYAYFQALKNHFNGADWRQWPAKCRDYENALKSPLRKKLSNEFEAQKFFQYLFFGQWKLVRDHAASRGIRIIGDIPIFVALDSADVWQNQRFFQIDPKTSDPIAVAGCPPDYFSEDGQYWGNPLYDWKAHENDGYSWWIDRLNASFGMHDIVRIDHFRGFDSYWSIPYGSETAREGEWVDGPGIGFFKTVKKAIPDCRLIAEDLGELTPGVRSLRETTGLPGMSILQFAFGGEGDNLYLPHNVHSNTVLYPGTHDNDTSIGWYRSTDEKTQDHVRRYLDVSGENIGWDFIRAAYKSVAKLAIIPLQDIMSLDSEARFNSPGQAMGNWQWRYQPVQLRALYGGTSDYLKSLAELYYREWKPETGES
ncbi:MAG TPA: 4-alpha-glucanotransferase [Opitutae bacterium]|nr:4-alpha-glucanotransferase [Opitutae bacterium]